MQNYSHWLGLIAVLMHCSSVRLRDGNREKSGGSVSTVEVASEISTLIHRKLGEIFLNVFIVVQVSTD